MSYSLQALELSIMTLLFSAAREGGRSWIRFFENDGAGEAFSMPEDLAARVFGDQRIGQGIEKSVLATVALLRLCSWMPRLGGKLSLNSKMALRRVPTFH